MGMSIMGMSVHEPAAAEYLPASHTLHVAAAVARAVCSERRQARSSTRAYARQSAACTGAVLHVTTEDDAHAHAQAAHDEEQQQQDRTTLQRSCLCKLLCG